MSFDIFKWLHELIDHFSKHPQGDQLVHPALAAVAVASQPAPVPTPRELTVTEKLFGIAKPSEPAPAPEFQNAGYPYPPKFDFDAFGVSGVNSYKAGVPAAHTVTMPHPAQGGTGFVFDIAEVAGNPATTKGASVSLEVHDANGNVVAKLDPTPFTNALNVSVPAVEGAKFTAFVTSSTDNVFVVHIGPLA